MWGNVVLVQIAVVLVLVTANCTPCSCRQVPVSVVAQVKHHVKRAVHPDRVRQPLQFHAFLKSFPPKIISRPVLPS